MKHRTFWAVIAVTLVVAVVIVLSGCAEHRHPARYRIGPVPEGALTLKEDFGQERTGLVPLPPRKPLRELEL